MAALRVIFMGSAELSCASLRALMDSPDILVAAFVTQPDRPKGRDLKLRPSPVKELALRANLPVLQPARARDEAFVAELRALQPDLIAVAAYGQILPPGILELPRFGCLNVHTSLLPRWRGAAPIQWAILNGDARTGVTIMKMDAGLDTGAILAQEETDIGPRDNSQTLHDRLAEMGAKLLLRTIPGCVARTIQPRPQPAEGVTYAAKLRKEDGRIRLAPAGHGDLEPGARPHAVARRIYHAARRGHAATSENLAGRSCEWRGRARRSRARGQVGRRGGMRRGRIASARPPTRRRAALDRAGIFGRPCHENRRAAGVRL